MLSQAIEDYLKTIYKLQERNSATTNEIARSLGIAAASVTSMIKRLSEMGLVHYTAHKGVALSEAGRKIALEIIRHHRLLELYLMEALGYSWDRVHEEAEKLEHHISEEFEDRIAEFLGHPTHDPHGDPIPTKDGELPEFFSQPLVSVPEGECVSIRRVSAHDPELLRYLAELGLKPNTEVTIVSKAPFNGPVTLQISGQERIIGREVAGNLFVSVVERAG